MSTQRTPWSRLETQLKWSTSLRPEKTQLVEPIGSVHGFCVTYWLYEGLLSRVSSGEIV